MHPETQAHRPKHRRAVRLGLGALAATAALTALPAMASAVTRCDYIPNNQLIQVRMDGGPAKPLIIVRGGTTDERVFVRTEGEAFNICPGPSGSVGTLSNTKQIDVRRATFDASAQDTVVVDESDGRLVSANGNAPNIVAITGTGGDVMRVVGTPGKDRYTVFDGAPGGEGFVSLGRSGSGSFRMLSTGRIELIGNGELDELGRRFSSSRNTIPLTLIGGTGNDGLYAGNSGPRSERITGSGALKLVESETSIAKKGKTVTARLGLLPSNSLAGKSLALDVDALDRNGKRQLEPGAAELRVAQ